MNLQQVLDVFSHRMKSQVGDKTVYGEPIQAEGKTIIPVSRVAFGLGLGQGTNPHAQASQGGEIGMGMGGGFVAQPVGVLEVTQDETRFIPCQDIRKWLGVLLLGVGIGLWLKKSRY
jgi:uncharacterized spore protein YtfJ